MKLILISGVSGSGKSVALKALEDIGVFCVDNLPPALFPSLIEWLESQKIQSVAVSIDARIHHHISEIEPILAILRSSGSQVSVLFLETNDITLSKRFSETRRPHPLITDKGILPCAIASERDLLSSLKKHAWTIDTSEFSIQQLRRYVQEWADLNHDTFHLVIQSFGFKKGIPIDVDYIFDVRCLPNPYYDEALRLFSGQDKPIIDYFKQHPVVHKMIMDITHFLTPWIQEHAQNTRSYLSIGIGCTGGQHRSVYIAEQLCQHFQTSYPIILRHRQLDK